MSGSPAGEGGPAAETAADAAGAQAPAAPGTGREAPRHILLTGATGFLGAHLACELLRQTPAELTCLVRGADDQAAAARLRETFAFYFPEDPPDFARITPLAGDLGRDGLDLAGPRAAARLRAADTIVHAAADVRHFGPYEQFRNINVKGTARLLAIAQDGACRRFHHISTLGVAGDRVPGTDAMVFGEDDYDRGQVFDNVYGRTKFEAEALVRAAREAGLATTIHRVGVVVGEAASGRFQRNIEANAFYGLLRGILELGLVLSGGRLEMTPVDACRRALTELILSPQTAGECLHVFNPNYIDSADLGAKLHGLGYQVRALPPEDLGALLEGGAQAPQGLEYLVPHLAGSAGPRTAVTFDNRRTAARLAARGFEWPLLDDRLVANLVEHAVAVGFLPPPAGTMGEAEYE